MPESRRLGVRPTWAPIVMNGVLGFERIKQQAFDSSRDMYRLQYFKKVPRWTR